MSLRKFSDTKPQALRAPCASTVAIFILSALMLVLPCSAQTTEKNSSRQTENRFLFICETSAVMGRSAKAAQNAVLDLIQSAMQGQMQDGDTFGIWTYDEKLRTEFPMQVWSAQSSPAIMEMAAAYLRSQRYEKKARFEKVLPPLSSVIKASRTLTVVLISNGTGVMAGTPFDKDINELHREYAQELHAANLPFVTVLAARDGEIFDYTVNASIGPIRIPETAEPVKKVERAAAAVVAPAATNVAAPVAISSAPAVPKEPRKIEIVLIHPPKTNVASPAETVVSTEVVPPVSPPRPEPVAQAAVAPVESKIQVPTAPPVATQTAPITVPASYQAESPKIQPAALEAMKPQPPSAAVQPSAPTAVATERDVSQPAPVSSEPLKKSEPAVSKAESPARAETKPANTAALPPVVISTVVSPWMLLLVGVVFLGMAVALVVLIMRGPRATPQSSLISQSLDRSK